MSLEILLLMLLAIAGTGAFFLFFNKLATTGMSHVEQNMIYPELPPTLLSLTCYTNHGKAEFLTDSPLEGTINYEVKQTNGTLVKQGTIDLNFTEYDTVYFGALMNWGKQYQVKFYTPSWSLVDTCTSKIHGNVIMYFPFDEGNGTAVNDLSKSSYSGTVYGANWTVGKRGKALEFDGTNDYVNISKALPTKKGTILLWIKPVNTSDIEHLVYSGSSGGNGWGSQDEIHLSLYHGKESIYFGSDSTNGEYYSQNAQHSLSNGTWVLLSGTYSDSGTSLYVNGSLEANLTDSKLINPSIYDWTLVGRPLEANYFFDGMLDDLYVYNTVLSQEEIQAIYRAYN